MEDYLIFKSETPLPVDLVSPTLTELFVLAHELVLKIFKASRRVLQTGQLQIFVQNFRFCFYTGSSLALAWVYLDGL